MVGLILTTLYCGGDNTINHILCLIIFKAIPTQIDRVKNFVNFVSIFSAGGPQNPEET